MTKPGVVHPVTHHIRAWRHYRKMTLAQLAGGAGLTESMISQLEVGRSRWTQNSLQRIAAALDVEPWQLLCDEPTAVVLLTVHGHTAPIQLGQVRRAAA